MEFLNRLFGLGIALLVASSFSACNSGQSADQEEVGFLAGKVTILVDETVLPIIEDQVAVFEGSYPKAHITLRAMPETEVGNTLLKDSSGLAVMTRQLNKQEEEFFVKQKRVTPRITRFATDAIAVIAGTGYQDSVIHVKDLITYLKGESANGISFVFDNPNSSTVSYLKELAGVDKLPNKGFYSMKSNSEVIRYVYEHPQSVGVIGLNWLVQPSPELKPMVEKIKVLGVKNQEGLPGDDDYYTPTQSNLALKVYPLSRPLYYINVQGKRNLGMGFSSFLYGERGQRLILKSGLLPDSIPPREIYIRN